MGINDPKNNEHFFSLGGLDLQFYTLQGTQVEKIKPGILLTERKEAKGNITLKLMSY